MDNPNGDPLLMKSDFYYLNDQLNAKLDTLYATVAAQDVDGDNRLRPNHPVEGQGLGEMQALADEDGNEYIDDFDLFLGQFDSNNDDMVVYDATLASQAGKGSLAEEFTGIDAQMCRLIDEAVPDRNGDGVVDSDDTQLGYKDGIIGTNDVYAKVRGRLMFAVSKAAWEESQGESYHHAVQGPVRPDADDAPISFQVGQDELREITTDMFNESQIWYADQVTDDFQDQVDSSSGTYTPVTEDTPYEEVPYGSEFPYDYYKRPVYEDMTFTNVTIPEGNNGLFINCTFKGVTYIETEANCTHQNWNFAGVLTQPDPEVEEYELKYPGLAAEFVDSESGQTITAADTRDYSNNIRFHNCTFLGSIAGDRPLAYTQVRNKVQMTGETRFYIDPNDEDLAEQSDSDELTGILNSIPEADRAMMERSSIMMPGWSMDVGSFQNVQAADPEDTPKVKLKGTIVSGILDIRGTAEVHGTLLMTFRPTSGQGPLSYYPDVHHKFNTTIGYFGQADGDGEGVGPEHPDFPGFGEIRLRYDPNAKLPDGIPWPVSAEPEPLSYVEGTL